MLIKELRRIVRDELLKECANTNAEVVLTFLRDRQVEPRVRELGLERLIDEPNLENELENHMRASALVGCKGEALDWLGLNLIRNEETAMRRFSSASEWAKQPMDQDWFRIEALNVWGEPFYSSAEDYLTSNLHHGETEHMFDGANEAEIKRALSEPSTTIWIPGEKGIKCVEGNKRLHALALGMAQGMKPVNGWQMWVRKT